MLSWGRVNRSLRKRGKIPNGGSERRIKSQELLNYARRAFQTEVSMTSKDVNIQGKLEG